MSFDIKKMAKRELNVGLKDQKIRYGVGIGLTLISVFLANIPLLIVGSILLASARLRWCPVYSGLGRSTVDPTEEQASSAGGAGHH
ncbi:YgaP family membrane protein [Methylocaldum sp. MU1018]